MPNLRFTRAEVEEEAGKKPWTRQREFTAEINPDDMGDTAAVYARAAGEASGAGELAQHATDLGADSGGIDGGTLVDAEGRIDETARGLQGNGQDMDEVVTYLVRAMNQAIDTEREVYDLVYAEGFLEEAYVRQLAGAQNSWDGWQQALTDAVAAHNSSSAVPGTIALPVTHDGRTINADHAESGGGVVYSLPASLATEIREKHLRNAADFAVTYDAEMADAIEAYRRKLAEYGQQLGELGYDLSDGPLGIFTTDEMGEYAGQQLAEELAKDNPNPDVLLMYTEGLDSIVLGIYAEGADPGAAQRELTASELAYLEKFYGQLDADDLAALGALTEDTRGLDPGEAGRQYAGAQRVANGLNMLLNPDIGGIDPAARPDRVPEGIRPFVYNYENSDLYPSDESGRAHPTLGSDAFNDELRRFNGFGDLMGTATIGSGEQFSEDLAHAAVDVQTRTSLQYSASGYDQDYVENTFGSGLLSSAALNTEASAGLLNDADFRDQLLSQRWEDSQGAAELIASGTTIPPGVDHNSDEARRYVEAGYHVLTSAPAHADGILAKNSMMTELGHSDHTALQNAIGDTSLQYMDMLSKSAQETGFSVPGDPDDPNARTDRNLFGNDYRYSFELSRGDREALFSLMNSTGDEPRQNFLNGVGAWQETTAYNAFVRDSDGNGDQAAAFDAIGRVAGTVQHVQDQAEVSGAGTGRGQSSMIATIAAAGSAVKDVTPPLPGKLAVIAGTYGVAESVRHALPDPAALQSDLQMSALEHGDTPVRSIVADAAVRADYRGAGGTELPDPTSSDTGEEDLRRAYLDLESASYDSYRDSLVEAYNDAIGD
ncbi:TPR repeat region-containing protein [Streptomyces litchfieldiae]|uniref:TPR repeat domain-containing protein n=1 Tax=Streptomyces litchfieldiae TaxID=3075543 RepID=A0ABU2MYY6_9ACTN|nr:hypothetical protein [Streptomyces sp. DSM 44938]MDT0346572.1 hypothetical protein [Streptomyces sp. DSM 44938]